VQRAEIQPTKRAKNIDNPIKNNMNLDLEDKKL
jgi:hypothetical protein